MEKESCLYNYWQADTQKIVLDFEKSVTYAQGLIYRKMLDCRKNTESKKSETDTSSHSPIRYTAIRLDVLDK